MHSQQPIFRLTLTKSKLWTKTYLVVANNHYIWPLARKTPQRALLADSEGSLGPKVVYFTGKKMLNFVKGWFNSF